MLGRRLRVIVEIEESNVKPTQICGKFLTSALSHGLMHRELGDEVIPFDDNTLFVQILDTRRLRKGTSKLKQWRNLEDSIRQMVPIRGSKISRYSLIPGEVADFEDGAARRALLEELRSAFNAKLQAQPSAVAKDPLPERLVLAPALEPILTVTHNST